MTLHHIFLYFHILFCIGGSEKQFFLPLRESEWMYDALHYYGKAFRQHPDLLQTARKVTEFNFFYADRTYYLCNAEAHNPSPCPTCTAAEVRSAIVFDVKPRIHAAFPDTRETVSTFFSSRGEAVSVSSTDLVEEAVQVLKRDLLHVLDDYILKYLTDDESCVQPGDLIQPSMREIARRSQVNMARLHVLQLHYLEQPSPSSSCATCLGAGVGWGSSPREREHRRRGGGENKNSTDLAPGSTARGSEHVVDQRRRRGPTVTNGGGRQGQQRLRDGRLNEFYGLPYFVGDGDSSSQHVNLRFHDELGTHRNEIIANLVAKAVSAAGSSGDPNDKTSFRYLEIGVMNGDNAAAVWHRLTETGSRSTSRNRKIGFPPNVEMHLVDPFVNATASYFQQMQPWGLDYRLQTKRRTRVKYRFHGVAVQLEPQLQLVQKNDHELKYSSLENYGAPARTSSARHENLHVDVGVKLWTKSSREAFEHLRNEDLDPTVLGNPGTLFNVMFIDGDHSYEETLFDLQAWSKLCQTNTSCLLIVHDYSADCTNCEYEVVRAMRDFIAEWNRVDENGGQHHGTERASVSRRITTLHTAPDVLAWVEI